MRAPCRGQRDQWYLFKSASNAHLPQHWVVPILTWGFDRSKTVASPRIPFASLPKTCCIGLTPFCCRRASRLVRSIGANERVTTTILSHLTRTPEVDSEGMIVKGGDGSTIRNLWTREIVTKYTLDFTQLGREIYTTAKLYPALAERKKDRALQNSYRDMDVPRQ